MRLERVTHDEAFELAPVWYARWLEVRSFIALHLARAARKRAIRATRIRVPPACAKAKGCGGQVWIRLRLGLTLGRLEVDCAVLSGVGAPGLLIFLARLAREQLARTGSLSLTS